MKIGILDDYTDTARTTSAFARLAGHDVKVWTDRAPTLDTVVQRLRDIEVLILIRERMRVTEELLAQLPKLKMISHLGIHPNVDVEACTRHRVLFSDGRGTRRPFNSISSTAELTWSLILASMRRLPREVAALKAGVWQLSAGRTVFGKTLGVYGYASTGMRVAAIGRAFGMDVQVWGRGGSQQRAAADGYRIPESREIFFETSDVLSLHMRLVPETHGLVTSADLARMKPDALLVNTSRGPLIAPGALETALEAGRPGAAAVDVYNHEPVLDGEHPLLHMDHVICTPHLGYATQEQLAEIFEVLVDNVLAYAEGNPTGVVNTDVLAGFVRS
jgi:D-3-phosphoglycerate dehydrogenase / 2-oxoglutarate reductase